MVRAMRLATASLIFGASALLSCSGGGGSKRATVTVTASGSGGGIVRSGPGGIECGADCTEPFVVGTEVVLVALATRFEG